MAEDPLVRRYKMISRLTLAVVVLVVVAGYALIGARASELASLTEEVETSLDQRERLVAQVDALTTTLRSLTNAPDGGVRAVAKRLRTEARLYDIAVWIDASQLSKPVREVNYSFGSGGYEPRRSDVAATGFSVYLRGSGCPGETVVAIRFDDATAETITVDLCQRLGMD